MSADPTQLGRGIYRYQAGTLVILVAIDRTGQLVAERSILAPSRLDELNASTDLLLALHTHEKLPNPLTITPEEPTQ